MSLAAPNSRTRGAARRYQPTHDRAACRSSASLPLIEKLKLPGYSSSFGTS